MESGVLAAQACFDELNKSHEGQIELLSYPANVKQSWMADEIYKARNIRPGFHHGLFAGLINAAFETYITKGKSPWTLNNRADYSTLKLANQSKKIPYPKPDGVLTFDLPSSVYLTNTYHEENQPVHLTLRDKSLAINVNYEDYASPETRYCPAGVYEIVQSPAGVRLQINAQNCIHCKTCDIKDPRKNIIWTAPEGGGGPNYVGM